MQDDWQRAKRVVLRPLPPASSTASHERQPLGGLFAEPPRAGQSRGGAIERHHRNAVLVVATVNQAIHEAGPALPIGHLGEDLPGHAGRAKACIAQKCGYCTRSARVGDQVVVAECEVRFANDDIGDCAGSAWLLVEQSSRCIGLAHGLADEQPNHDRRVEANCHFDDFPRPRAILARMAPRSC